jgi:hypothetical protein
MKLDDIINALELAREKHGAKWIGALPLKQRGGRDTAVLLGLTEEAACQADDMLAERPTRMSMLMSEVGEALYVAFFDSRESARTELLQVAAMAAQWAEDLDGDGR